MTAAGGPAGPALLRFGCAGLLLRPVLVRKGLALCTLGGSIALVRVPSGKRLHRLVRDPSGAVHPAQGHTLKWHAPIEP